jgi:branched-chain amino acid transport system substrate-binding protein
MKSFKMFYRLGTCRPILLVSVAILIGLMFAICSNPLDVAAQDTVIRIGTLMPLSGAGGPFGENMQRAAIAAVKEINAAGGPLGKRIQLFNEDTQTDPEAAVRGAKKLIELNKVSAVIGTWASSVTLAVAPVALDNKVVEMSTSGASRITKIQKKGFIYRTEPDDLLFGRAYGEYALQRNWKRAGVLGLNVPFTETTVAAFQKRFESGGGKLLQTIIYNPGQSTYRTETLRAFEGNPDFIHISGYGPDLTSILRGAYQSGLKGVFVVPGFAVSANLLKNAGTAAEGILLVEEGVAEKTMAYKHLVKLMGEDKYYSFAAQAYDMIQLIALAIEAAGDKSGEAINSKMREISGPPGVIVSSFEEGAKALKRGKAINYEGASGPVDFDENGNITKANFRISEIQKGKVVPIDSVKNVKF